MELHEVWSDHNFMIETCCEGMHEWMSRELAAEVDEGKRRHRGSPWLRQLFSSRGVAMRRLVEDDGHLITDFGLSIDESLPWRSVREFIVEHHRHNRPPAGWKFGAGCRNGSTLIGVVSVGRPVSRILDARQDHLEVNRLCLSNQVPYALRHNASSMLYGWAGRQAEKRGYDPRFLATFPARQ
ncbi:MAG: hypothetical protein P4L83_12005 [Nevskia sp.]|nr:hypothetical protein [Nevskia sp.]